MEKWIDRLMLGCVWLATALVIFTMVMLFFSLKVDAQCLAAGYPEARVTWNLKSYCATLDGAVTVRLEEINAD